MGISVGDRMYYREKGLTVEVEVLEIRGLGDGLSYRLKPLRTLPAFRAEVLSLGNEFVISERGKRPCGGWTLDHGEDWTTFYRERVESLMEAVY